MSAPTQPAVTRVGVAGRGTAAATGPAAPATFDASAPSSRLNARVAIQVPAAIPGTSSRASRRPTTACAWWRWPRASTPDARGRGAAGPDPRHGAAAGVRPDTLGALARDGAFDTLVVLPHGAWRTLATENPSLAHLPARVLDLSVLPRRIRGLRVQPARDVARRHHGRRARREPRRPITAATLALLPAAEQAGCRPR